MASPRAQLPPRLLTVLYFGTAHASLALAFAAVAFDPRSVAGFSYHPRMVAIVHLVTLGWITASILGSLYIVGPIALRVRLPARSLDYGAFTLVTIGIVGMVAHFWIQDYGGMAWSAATWESASPRSAGAPSGNCTTPRFRELSAPISSSPLSTYLPRPPWGC